MKKVAVTFALALVLTVAASSGSVARADGPGLAGVYVLVGGQGVLSPSGTLRYVALTTGRRTIVSTVRVRGGQVLRWRILRGFFGVPVVALDGTTDSVSRDGRTLVLATATGGPSTTFAVLDTRTLRLRRIELRGSFSYDAISPDGATVYVIEYLGASRAAAYRVRALDVASGRLLPTPIADRRESEATMRGQPAARVSSRDGRWAYTLYARARAEPFVHALDTVRRRAYCVDLPLGPWGRNRVCIVRVNNVRR